MNAAPSKPLPHERIRLIGTPVGRMVRIDDFDDGHGPHQEKGDLSGTHQRFAELVRDDVVIRPAEGIDSPEHTGADKRGGRFVDLERVFQCYRGIGDHKNDDECSQHGVGFSEVTKTMDASFPAALASNCSG